jgi:hypothetical protein
MADFQNTIDLLGDEVVAKSIIDKTITGDFADDRLTKIGSYAFYYCDKLTSINTPAVTTIDSSAFHSCSGLVSVNLPVAQALNSNAFTGCKGLTTINIPAVKAIYGNSFQTCGKLTIIDFPSLLSIMDSSVFNSCAELRTIILRSATMCTLSNANAFTKTPFASGGTGGTVYVPQALIESYQAATNWSTLYAAGTCNFVAIEGSEYE